MNISESFTGKTAIITGAASGMGLQMAKTLVADGANVVMCDVNETALEGAVCEAAQAGPGRAFACASDVRRYADAERAAARALDETGRIDLLVNFAGGWEPRMLNSLKPFHEQPQDVIDWSLDVNLRGAVYFSRAVLPAMIAAKRGVICCLGSVNLAFGCAMGPLYGVAKAGLSNFVKGLALDGAPHGVRAFCVAPGPVLTRPGMAAMETPLGRAATPQEVVDFILYLASERGGFVTGSTHFIDGGFTAMRPKP